MTSVFIETNDITLERTENEVAAAPVHPKNLIDQPSL